MKNRLTILNSALLIAVISLLFIDRCGDKSPVLVGDTIRERIESRDTLLIERDTVVYRVREIKNLITEYRNTTDTVLKLIRCDSIISECDSLADQFNRQDSIFREQIVDYKLLVSVQDSMLKVKPKRRWVIIPVPIPFRRR